MNRSDPMPLAFSLYLDVLRFVAATAVFLDHLTSYPFTDNTRGPREGVALLLGSHGAVAVTLFSVLSGYVIAYVAATRERSAGDYAISRVSRLYSVVLPAIALTWFLDTAGQWLQPDFYAIQKVMWRPPSLQGYGSGLFLVNEWQLFNWGGVVPGTNAPYWSLSFEATYYLLAGLALFARRWVAVIAGIAVLALAGRTITALLPLWVLGFWLYHARDMLSARLPAPRAVAIATGLLLLALPHLLGPVKFDNFGLRFEWGRGPFNRNLLLDYAAAFLFAVHLVATYAVLKERPSLPGPSASVVRWLGTLTFPFYAIHYPALCFFAAVSPFDRESVLSMAFVVVTVCALVTAVTPVCESLKAMMRARIRGATRLSGATA